LICLVVPCFHFGSLHRPLEFAHGGFARVRLARAEWFDPGTAMADALPHSHELGIVLRKSPMTSNGTRFAMTLKKSHRFELDSETSPSGCVCSVKISVRERAVDLVQSLLGKGGTTDFQVRPCGILRTRKSVVPLNQQPASQSGRLRNRKVFPGTVSI
jgi:hypothetical protein